MSALAYVTIPPSATRLPANKTLSLESRPTPSTSTTLPDPSVSPPTASPTATTNVLGIGSPTKAALSVLPQLLLSASTASAAQVSPPRTSPHVQSPSTSQPETTPKEKSRRPLSIRNPLSIPMTTANFRRFVPRVGPVFWFQDRVEEIVMWRRGWTVTATWAAVWTTLCLFPRLLILLPNCILIGIMVYHYPTSPNPPRVHPFSEPSSYIPNEGSADWQANIQGIQNLMGISADLFDLLIPIVPYLTHNTPYSRHVLTALTVLTVFTLPLLVVPIPFRAVFIFLGTFPLLLTHPFTLSTVFPLLRPHAQNIWRSYSLKSQELMDEDRLSDSAWRGEKRLVEIWENERWEPKAGEDDSGEWSKAYLRTSDRAPWTRDRDGFSEVIPDGNGHVTGLTFSLGEGWTFIDTEDWRIDLNASWVDEGSHDPNPAKCDARGWVYTSDIWHLSHPVPLEEWKAVGMTRRRRWTRRVYYDPAREREA